MRDESHMSHRSLNRRQKKRILVSVLGDFSIDLLTITAGAVLALTIITGLQVYTWMAIGFLVPTLAFRYWKRSDELRESG